MPDLLRGDAPGLTGGACAVIQHAIRPAPPVHGRSARLAQRRVSLWKGSIVFETLSGKLTDTFDRLRKRGTLSEADVADTLREMRLALLDADVALPVVRDFTARVRERALGVEVLDSVAPGQQVIKVVQDSLVEALGGAGAVPLNLAAAAPVPVLMVGLQGSGKTTTSGKIALRLHRREKRRVLLASLDTQRPAAQLQLAQLATQAGVPSLSIVAGQTPVEIARRAMDTGRREGFDVVILDTAGRPVDRPGLDGRSARHTRRDQPGGDPAGRGRHDRPRRGEHGARLQRGRRRDRHRADPHGWRRPVAAQRSPCGR